MQICTCISVYQLHLYSYDTSVIFSNYREPFIGQTSFVSVMTDGPM